ncbi:MMPL family transporter [Acidithiobacillus sp.]|uniref:MMPL family transporter n=1 Tax=Acidithiobacillus sp. TaxID=1872118 RepID=UPI0025C65887|nr:MMPL family transporter [Acidithiobacillus sp.]
MIFPAADRFLERLGKAYGRLLVTIVDGCVRFSGAVLLFFLVALAASVYFVVGHFAINTDTSNALSRDLPFQQREAAYKKAFPQDHDSIVVVIQGQSRSATDDAVDRLEGWLRAHRETFPQVYVPGGGSFFRRNGLLYLPTAQVEEFAKRITDAQPLIARLSADPSIGGLSTLLSQAIDHELSGGSSLSGLTKVYGALNGAILANLQGKPYTVSWAELMGGKLGDLGPSKRFVIIQPAMNYQALEPAAAAIHSLRAGLHSLQLDPAHGVQVGITGSAVLDAEQLQTVSHGAAFSLILTFILEILLVSIALRSVRLVTAVFVSLISGIAFTTAWALFFIGPFNLISIAFAILFVGLGVDFGIQFCMRYREELFNGAPHREAISLVTRGIGAALTLAAVAAALSFFAFVPTTYAGIVDLGLVSGGSMLIALFLTITMVPAILTAWPISASSLRRVTYPHFRKVPTLARHPIHRYAYWVLGAVVLLALAAIPAALRVSFDFNPLHMIDKKAEGVRVFESLLADPDTAPYRIEVLRPNLAGALATARRLDSVPTVARTLTIDSYIPKDQPAKLAILQNLQILVPPFSLLMPATLTRPDDQKSLADLEKLQTKLQELIHRDTDASKGSKPSAELIAARQLSASLARFLPAARQDPARIQALQESVLGTLPGELKKLGEALMASPVTVDTLPKDLRERYLNARGQARVEVFPKENLDSNRKMLEFVRSVQRVVPDAVGTPVMLIEGGEAVLSAFRQATFTALISISLLLLLALRRYRDMLLIMGPLMLAALFTVAAMSLFGLSFNLGNIIVLPLLIGLGVAFAIYLVLRWRSGVDVAHLLQTSTPMAVFFSGLTTLSAFGSLALSSDPGMASLGKALSLALAMVLLSILVVLPALLLIFTHSPQEEGMAADEGS